MLQNMLNIVEKIGHKLQLKFNPDKTNYLAINDNINIKNAKYSNDQITLTMEGSPIEQVNTFRYLGSMISVDLKNGTHVSTRLSKAIAIGLKIKRKGFLSDASGLTLAQIHKTYVRTVLYYGL